MRALLKHHVSNKVHIGEHDHGLVRLELNWFTTANIPIRMTRGGSFAQAFGTDRSLVIWETSVEKAFASKTGEKKEGAAESESKLTAQSGLYCVDCGVRGNAHLQGILEYALPSSRL